MSDTRYSNGPEVINRLPSSAKLKLLTFRDEAEVKRAMLAIATDKAREAHRVKGTLEVALGRMKSEGGRRTVGVMEAQRKAEAELALQTAEHARLNKARDDLYAVHQLQVGPLPRIEAWLGDNPRAKFVGVPPADVTRAAGEDWPKFIEGIRTRIVQLKAEAERVVQAPIPSKVAKALAAKMIDDLAQVGRPDVRPVLKGGKIIWAGGARWGGEDDFGLHAFMAWVDRDRLVAKVHAEIDAVSDDKNALTEAQAVKEKERLRVALLEAEREEEAAIVAASMMDLCIVPRRMDADPRAILGLADNVPGFEDI